MISEIVGEYIRNEDDNFHHENLLLLANNFGSAEDKVKALSFLNRFEKDDPSSYLWSQEVSEFASLIWKKYPLKSFLQKRKYAKFHRRNYSRME